MILRAAIFLCLTFSISAAGDGAPSVAGVEVVEGHLGWRGVALGERVEALERRFGVLNLQEDPYTEACGTAFVEIELGDRSIRVQLSGHLLESEVESIRVPLLPGEADDLDYLSALARREVPELEIDSTDRHFLRLGDTDEGVLLKPQRPDRAFWISSEGCLD